jgi:hypothetical protein
MIDAPEVAGAVDGEDAAGREHGGEPFTASPLARFGVEAEQAEAVAVRFAPDIVAVNGYARKELLGAAVVLTRAGAPQGRVIRESVTGAR